MSNVGRGYRNGQVLVWNSTRYQWMPTANPTTGGQVLSWNGSALAWATAPSGFTAGGDLSGTPTSQTVIRIRNRNVATTAPTDGQVLAWNATGSQWEPQTVSAGGATPAVYATYALAEAATGTDNDLCYVVETDTWYRYEATDASLGTVDHKVFLATGDGGNTRWLALAGRYGNIANSRSPILSENYATYAFLGVDALKEIGSPGDGYSVVALGYNAGMAMRNGHSNTLVGAFAGRDMVDGSSNVVVGLNAALTASSDQFRYNVVIGINAAAGIGAASMWESVIIGKSAGYQSSGYNCVYIGTEAGYGAGGTSTGASNVGIGYQSLYNGPSGTGNFAAGEASGYALAAGEYNFLLGKDAGKQLTDGHRNCGLGVGCLAGITTGSYNVAIGDASVDGTLDANRSYAVGIGYRSGGHGGDNTIYIGNSCGWNTGLAPNNIGIGYHALMGGASVPLTGTYNIAIGDETSPDVVGAASENVTIGRLAGFGLTLGSDNILMGTGAGYSLAASGHNIALGDGSQYNATQASVADGENVTLGTNSGRDITSGETNTCMGYESGRVITTGSGNTCLGSLSRVDSGAAANRTAVGYNAECLTDNDVRLGELGVATVHGGTYTTDSDARFKTCIEDCDIGLDFVCALKPRKYQMKVSGYDEMTPEAQAEAQAKQGIHHGFIAQEVEALLASIGVESNIHDVQPSADGFNPQAINYTAMIAPLVKAVQELTTMVDDLQAEVTALEKGVE